MLLELIAMVMIGVWGDGSQSRPGTRQTLWALALAGIVGVAVMVIVHLTWDPVGSSRIMLQGRYFIPIGPLVGIGLSRLGTWTPPGMLRFSQIACGLAIACIPCILFITGLTIYSRYFVDSDADAAKRCFVQAISRLNEGNYRESEMQLQQALAVDPSNTELRNWLLKVKATAHDMRAISQSLVDRAMTNPLGQKQPGMSPGGWFLPPNRETVLDDRGRPAVVEGFRFVWRSPAPSGRAVRVIADENGDNVLTESQIPCFYACSTELHNRRRIFVFPAPFHAAILLDEEVSWFFQRRLIDLTPAEREREQEYRAKLNLKFPLSELP